MSDITECPYCDHENDMTDALSDGLSNDNTFDWECSNCEEEFEVYVEFEPIYSSSKIEYVECEKCGTETRDICEKGRIFPYPKEVKEKKICRSCFHKALHEEYSKS